MQDGEVEATFRRESGSVMASLIRRFRSIDLAEESVRSSLEALAALALDGYQPFHATRAELLRRLGRIAQAGEVYRSALALTTNPLERRFLEERCAELEPRAEVHGAPRVS